MIGWTDHGATVRPTELDERTAKRLVEATRKGLGRKVAARLAGISPTTLFNWIRRGRKGESPYVELVAQLKEAEAHGEESLVDLIDMHAASTWQAAAWRLERRYPERYGPPKQRLQHEVTPMTPEQAAAKYRELTGKEWGEK
jgi:transposase